jgi:phage portal protein BeeE
MSVLSNFFSRFSASNRITSFGFIGNESSEVFNHRNKGYGIDSGYAGNTDIFAIINMIKSKAIDIPLKLQKTVNDETEEVTSGELFDFINKPNQQQTLSEFNENLILYYLTTGNSIIETKKEFTISGRIESAINLHFQNTEIVTVMKDRLIIPKYYEYNLAGKHEVILPENIIHAKYANASGCIPYFSKFKQSIYCRCIFIKEQRRFRCIFK